jgi:hypothetical protein
MAAKNAYGVAAQAKLQDRELLKKIESNDLYAMAYLYMLSSEFDLATVTKSTYDFDMAATPEGVIALSFEVTSYPV